MSAVCIFAGINRRMLAVDTLKLVLPGAAVDCDLRFFDKIELPQTSGHDLTGIRTIYRQNKRDRSGAFLRFDPLEDSLSVEFSAKVLGDEYMRGLNRDTFLSAIEAVEKVNGVHFKRQGLEHGTVRRADVALNYRLPEGVSVADALLVLKHSLFWPLKKERLDYDSLLWHNSSETLTVYDKEKEVKKWNALVSPDWRGVLRVEWRGWRSAVTLRRFELREARLVDILHPQAQKTALSNVWASFKRRQTGQQNVMLSFLALEETLRRRVINAENGAEEWEYKTEPMGLEKKKSVLAEYILYYGICRGQKELLVQLYQAEGKSGDALRKAIRRTQDKAALLISTPALKYDIIRDIGEFIECA